MVLFFHPFILVSTVDNQTILDEQGKRLQKSPTSTSPAQLRVSSGDDSNSGNQIDPLSKQESIVKIMVESPKEPPNVEFGVAFPQTTPTTVVRIKTESTQSMDEQEQGREQQSQQSTDGSFATATDLQEPIDVNIPRDTTNIFYAYEETEVDNSFNEQQQQSTPDMPETSHQAIPPIEQADQTTMPTGNDSHDPSNNSTNQSVNIEQDSRRASDQSQSDNHTINSSSISGDNFRSSS